MLSAAQVVGSISELYSFMDAADSTLARKVLGEASEEDTSGSQTARSHLGEEEGAWAGTDRKWRLGGGRGERKGTMRRINPKG